MSSFDLGISPQAAINALNLSFEMDKPVKMDYYEASINKAGAELHRFPSPDNPNAILTVLYKDEETFTSPIQRMFAADNCYICVTENSIYLVHGSINQ